VIVTIEKSAPVHMIMIRIKKITQLILRTVTGILKGTAEIKRALRPVIILYANKRNKKQ
jgi:hypothetical protein